MSVLIKEIEDTIENKPVMSVNLGGLWQKRRLHIHVAAVDVQWETSCLRTV
jgi:hypothetical protein